MRCTLRYLSAILNYGIFCAIDEDLDVYGYMDANWAGSALNWQSTNIFMFSFGIAAITWSNKKQLEVVLSSTKVEYAVEMCEVAWSRLVTHPTWRFGVAN